MVDYQSSLGRSLECTSYAKALDLAAIAESQANRNMGFNILNPLVLLPYSNCVNKSSSTLRPPMNYLLAGIEVGNSAFDVRLPYCCGNCSFKAKEFRLLYFLTDKTSNCTFAADSSLVQSNATSSLHWDDGLRNKKHTSRLSSNFSSAAVTSNGYTL